MATPADWNAYKLDELGSVSRGKSKHRPRDDARLFGGPYPFVQTGDVKKASLYLTEYGQTYSSFGLEQSKLWPRGTLCITIAANIAETAILGIDACFPDSIVGFQAHPAKADVRYVKYHIDTIKLHFQSVSHGTTQDNLSVEKLLRFDFVVPPLAIQRRIADILSAYDDLIENNTKRIKILEEMARSLYREWFVEFRFPGHEGVKVRPMDSGRASLPVSWEVVSLKSIASKIGSGATPRGGKEAYKISGIALIRSMNVHDFEFVGQDLAFIDDDQAAQLEGVTVRPRDILLNITGASVARCCMVPTRVLPARVNQHVAIIRIDGRRADPRYVLETINSHRYKQTLLKLAQGGATREALTKDMIGAFEIPLPPTQLLQRYAGLVGPMFDAVESLRHTSDNLRRTRDLLLPRLLSGEIDVTRLPDPGA